MIIVGIFVIVLFVMLMLFIINYKYVNSEQYRNQFAQVQKFKKEIPHNIKYAYFGSTHSFFDFKIKEND